MNCVGCGSRSVAQRPEVTARGYRRFRCRDYGKQFNERSGGVLNRTCLPSDVIAFVAFCRLRYRLTLRDLSEILLLRGFTVSHEAIRDWEAKLPPVMGDVLRKRRLGLRRRPGCSWYVDETYLKVQGRWCDLYRRGRPRRRPERHHAQRDPGHGGGQAVLPIGESNHGLCSGSGDDGRGRFPPKGHPHDAGQDGPTPDECLLEQPARTGSSRHQGPHSMYARLQEPGCDGSLLPRSFGLGACPGNG
jgi:hypothetical protein